MRIVVTHTDFRLYWPARLFALRAFAQTQCADLQVIEITGKGSPYAFEASCHSHPDWWQCLFPKAAMESLSPSQACKALWGRLDRLQPDVVIAGAIAFPSGATALHWCAHNGKGCVIFDDARLTDVPRSFLVNWVKRRLFRHVDSMLIPAESHVPDYKWWGIPRDRLFYGVDVVNNAFFLERSDRTRMEGDRKRLELGITKPYYLGVGRLIQKKNWATLIQAFAQSQSEGQGETLSLVLVGDGPARDALEASVPAAVRDRVHFVGSKAQEGVCAYYALAEALVLPSRYGETWGLVVNEAMASGLPVIVSRECGCASTLVHEAVNGWVFDPNSVSDLADKLTNIAKQSHEKTAQMGQASLTIIADWGLDRFAKGAWTAIEAARLCQRRKPPLLDKILMRLWKGRYRPT